MMKTAAMFAVGALSVHAEDTHGLELGISMLGIHLEVPKSHQMSSGWLELNDEQYNSHGFYQWKPLKQGFVMKDKNSKQVSCHVKSNEHAAESEIKLGLDCDVKENVLLSVASKTAAHATSRFRAKLKNKFSPLSSPILKALNPSAQAEGALGLDGTKALGVIDTDVISSEGNPMEERTEEKMLDQIDLGRGSKAPPASHWSANSEMNDAPFVDAAVDREVNQRMFEFFKKHPSYHSPEANWRSARRWKAELGQGAPGAATDMDGSDDPSATPTNMWSLNSCSSSSKVPVGWPDVPDVKCANYVVSPMGYWGCKWLFEDGTCGNIQFYPTIRWDGLDSFVLQNHDEADEAIKQNGAFPGHSIVQH